ncbi:MAG TPA: glycosyltransferase family 2 protein [Phycisphaerae bacterium]|jgi:glycosyltransferase involved in cell wall biosynthesis|nr:glycosyltransferase family 2 protein [Phycisphaerae bacterium]
MSISILIPTKNEEVNLPHALQSAVGWAADVFVLDSGSTDKTREIAEKAGVTFVHHDWEGYARQKNWGLDNLPMTGKWVFILDADEVITPELRAELLAVAKADSVGENGFYVNRFFIFLNQRIRHCGYYPSWNLRFFRKGKARYEERDVHEHMVVDGKIGYLKHEMEHNDRRGMEFYIAKHNHYSTLEARELFKIERGMATGTMKFSFWGGPIERRRWIKHKLWPKLPLKWYFRFLYMYVFRLGVLDGVTGFHFCLFLASYEHQITLKLRELRQSGRL